MTFLPGILRIALALWLLVGAMWFGANGSGPWMIFALAAVFTVAFGIGRWRAWVQSWQSGRMTRAILAQFGTYAVQSVLCAFLFLAGRGISSFAGGRAGINLEHSELDRLVTWGGIGIGLGLVLVVLEKRSGIVSGIPAQVFDQVSDIGAPAQAFEADPDDIPSIPVSEETFFSTHHYRNMHVSGAAGTADYHAQVIAEKAFLTEQQISAEEERLSISLPPLLRRLYLRQNGGSGMSLAAPTTLDHHNVENGWINVFSGYDDMVPLTDLQDLRSLISHYASMAEQPEAFPDGCDRMIVLAQWYRETLFLDYRHGPDIAPRVGFCDFDDGDLNDLRGTAWEDKTEWWDNFDTFFASLRRRPSDMKDDA